MELIYSALTLFVTAIYILSIVLLCTFGLHRFYLAYLYKKYRSTDTRPAGFFPSLPFVTVQLPLYNERYVAERLITTVCNLDYPPNLLEIQVLDDSTDETTRLAENCVSYFASKGVNIKLLHRENRYGYKAGALEKGLETAKGEFIAIFDSDFVPPHDFLKNTIHHFTDPSVGIVQTRWGHLNINYSILTRVQSVLLDGHFIVEQTARFKNGVFLNFNGTGGILRRACIVRSGGWQHDTLTEDLDLSYRAQLKGWKMVYRSDVVCEAELPIDMNAFKLQQHRWAKGGIQTAKKLFFGIVQREDLPLGIKAESFFHLLGNFSYLLLVILLTLMLPMGYIWRSIGWEKVFMINVLTISAGTLSIFYFYLLAVREAHGEGWIRYVIYIPVAIAVGAGLAINNSKAVLEAFFGSPSEFRRTPKYAITKRPEKSGIKTYVTAREMTSFVELMLGILFLGQTIYAVYNGYFAWIPFLLMLQFGFIYTSVSSIYHSSGHSRV